MTRDIDRRRATSSLDSLTVFLDQATRDIDRLAAAGDYVALGDGLGRLRVLKRALAVLEGHAEDELAKIMPKSYIEEDGLVMRRRNTATAKRWQSEDLFRTLFGDQIIDARTGENVYETMTKVLPLTGSLSWRTTALRDIGVNIEDWAEVTEGRKVVQVQRADEAEQAKGDGDAIAPSDAD